MEGLWTLAALITGAVIALPFALALEWLWLWGLLRVVGAALRAPRVSATRKLHPHPQSLPWARHPGSQGGR